MLQVDPMKRATMEDIKNHEWFKKDLPAYLFPPPNEADASIVDIDAVQVGRPLPFSELSLFYGRYELQNGVNSYRFYCSKHESNSVILTVTSLFSRWFAKSSVFLKKRFMEHF